MITQIYLHRIPDVFVGFRRVLWYSFEEQIILYFYLYDAVLINV